MFLASLFLAITIKSYSSRFLLVEVEKEDNKVLKQEGEACGSIAAEPNSDCGECDEGLFCDTWMSPAPPMQCGKCVKQNAADRMVKMDLSSKEKVCKTVGSGNEVNKSCVFPFIYKSVAYDACTLTDRGKFWCNTEVDLNGIGVSEKWGYCNHFCPVEWPSARDEPEITDPEEATKNH